MNVLLSQDQDPGTPTLPHIQRNSHQETVQKLPSQRFSARSQFSSNRNVHRCGRCTLLLKVSLIILSFSHPPDGWGFLALYLCSPTSHLCLFLCIQKGEQGLCRVDHFRTVLVLLPVHLPGTLTQTSGQGIKNTKAHFLLLLCTGTSACLSVTCLKSLVGGLPKATPTLPRLETHCVFYFMDFVDKNKIFRVFTD